jgi:hypothetical protein
MNRAESLVIEAAKRLVVAFAPGATETPEERSAALMVLSLAVRALDRANQSTDGRWDDGVFHAALKAGRTLDEAFEAATGRPLDLRRRRLRDGDMEGRCCPDHRHG